MSLINDMLRDLEKRKGSQAPPEGVVLSGIGWRPELSRAPRLPGGRYLAAGVTAAALVAVYGLYFSGAPSGGDGALRSAHGPGSVAAPPAGGERQPQAPPAVAAPSDGGGTTPARTVVAAKAPDPAAGLALIGSIARGQDDAADGEGGAPPAREAPGPGAAGAGNPRPHPATPAARNPEGDGGGRAHQGAARRRAAHSKAAGAAQRSKGRVAKHFPVTTPEQRASHLHRAALALIRQGRAQEARDKLAAALAVEPDHAASRRALAGLMIKAGQLHAAGALLDEGLRLAPQDPSLIELRARVDVLQGDNGAARKLLEGHPPAMTADPSYHALLAAVYQRLGDYGRAGALYRKLVARQPRNGVWWLGLGISMEATGAPDEARRAYRRAQRTGSLSPQLKRFVREKLATR